MVIYGREGIQTRGEAYALLARAVREHWRLDDLPEMARGEHGKPFFPGYPQCRFNLSHSGGFALCALSGREVGADIQQIRPHRPGFAQQVCSPEELDWLDGGDFWTRFALLWSMKEAAVKYTGRGLIRPISAIRVPLPREGERLLEWEGLWFGLYAGPGWRGVVCGEELPPEHIYWE